MQAGAEDHANVIPCGVTRAGWRTYRQETGIGTHLVFGFLAGLLTLLDPCVLPVLPVVMASALGADRRGPLWLVAGMAAGFVALGLALAGLGPTLGISPEAVGSAAAVVMLGFGLVLLVPSLGAGFAIATAGLAARANAGIGRLDQAGPGRLLAAGALLGAALSPTPPAWPRPRCSVATGSC